MKGFPPWLSTAFAWLHAQAAAVRGTIGDVISNRPAPARNVIAYTLVLIALAVVIPRAVKAVSK